MKKIFSLFCITISLYCHAEPAPSDLSPSTPLNAELPQNNKFIKARLRPHQAEYTISLQDKSENISDVKGTMTIRLLDSMGWTLEYHIKMTILYDDHTKDEYESTIASFETADHQQYRFTLKVTLNNELLSALRGEAEIEDNEGIVKFKGSQDDMEIPGHTLFPLHLIRRILTDAKDSMTVNNYTYFGYYNTELTPLNMNVVIRPKKPNINVKGLQEIDFRKSYQLQMASFPLHDQASMDPQSTLHKLIQSNGITIEEDLFFPEFGFTIRAKLSKVELYEEDEETF
ncbi:MAG: DUF1849 family protein [Alphaproteobacteria bacterium]|nr:DUF1849 family protein [Alphaproteobacteria bacterium]